MLNNLAVCHERRFRYDLAMQFYQRYLAEGDPDDGDRQEVLATMRSLQARLATLRIETNVSAEVWVDDRMMGHAPGEVLVPAGRHVVELRARSHEAAQQELHIAAGERQVLRMQQQELYRGLDPAYFWVGVGLTGVAGALGATMGLRALAADSDGQDRRERLGPHGNTPQDEADVRRLAGAADLLFGATALLAVGTTVVAFLTDWEDTPQDQARAGTALHPFAGPSTAGFALQGAF